MTSNTAYSTERLLEIELHLKAVITLLRENLDMGEKARYTDLLGLAGDIIDFYRRYWALDMDWGYGELLKQLDNPADQLLAAARDIHDRGCPDAAVHLAETASRLDGNVRYQIANAEYLRRAGRVGEAKVLCRKLANDNPVDRLVLNEQYACDLRHRFWKMDYYDILAELHQKYTPRTYLEIGVSIGKSLALTRGATRVIGVDPRTAERSNLYYLSLQNTPQLYKMTSDQFFKTCDLGSEFSSQCFDVAFIDGLHQFDQVLRDFINIEQFAGSDSVIFIHDCVPVNPQVATRECNTVFWTGDVWKIIPCLKALRPDLEIVTLPAFPSGLAIVRRLDSASRVLSRQYLNIVEQFDSIELPYTWSEQCNLLQVEADESLFHLDSYLPSGGWS